MKIRDGFVSNSSSSSFVCHRCGESQHGWDWDENTKRRLCIGCFKIAPDYSLGKRLDEIVSVLDFSNSPDGTLERFLRLRDVLYRLQTEED